MADESARSADLQRASDKRRADDAIDANALRDRVTAAFGDHYLVEQEVGRGGMAVVYAATDVRLQRVVALKVLPPELAFRSDVRERFVREAQTAARLNHPHIVPIYAVHEHAGLVCFAMSLVTGESLAARIAREPRPSFEFIASILEQVADALAYAHAAAVVHRDIKPDNILLDKESGRALVTDFGIARAAESGSRLTQTGIAVGTPAFMSPEQATGERDVDGRSDVYSLGVVGYLMLAGRLPFEAATTPAMLVKHVSATPPPIRSVRADAPDVLVNILERCLAKRPTDRWENALAMRDALRRALRDGSLSARPSPYQFPPRAAPQMQPATVRAAQGYTDKYGHRHEDWSPQIASSPAPQMLAPQLPVLPPLPVGASREEYREWRHAVRDQRRDYRDQLKDQQRQLVQGLQFDGLERLSTRPLSRQISAFRYQVISNGAIMIFLGLLNSRIGGFPWAVFPAIGMSMGILSVYSRLRERGATWAQILGSESAGETEVEARRVALSTQPLSTPQRLTNAVNSLKRRVKWVAGSVAVAAASLVAGTTFHLNPLQVPFAAAIVTGLISLQLSIVAGVRVRRLGIPLTAALGDRWRELARAVDDRPHDVQLREAIDRLAGASVLASPFGDTLRTAVEDRLAIKDAASRLTDADRTLVPDVEPTADALLERVGALANGLERLDRDMPSDAMSTLDVRIAAAEAEPDTAPDHERRLTLLTRQRASLQELVERRETMLRQLDNASMALRTLRLDMVKLRTLGIGAVINDVTSATQEARALSVDIKRALQAADEVRRL